MSASSDTSSEASAEPIDLQAGADGWDDVEPDDEDLEVVSFFGRADGVFRSVQEMLLHCREKRSLDFVQAIQTLGMS